MYKENVIQINNGMLFSHRKSEILPFRTNDRTGDPYVK
jgi:hypothetical protein